MYKSRQLVCALIFLFAYTIYVASALVAGTSVFTTLFPDVSPKLAMFVFLLIIVAYTFFGGFTAVCWTDFFQGMLMLGALLIGFIAGAAEQRSFPPGFLLFSKTGLCGGFTTFSTFSLESYGLLKAGRQGAFWLYTVLSVGLCLLGIWLGHLAARRLYPLP